MHPILSLAALLSGLALLPTTSAWSAGAPVMPAGHDHSHHRAPQASPPAQPSGARVQLPDTVLTDQDGRPLRLLSDVVGDKVVVVSFVYTHCTTVCPVVSHVFSQVQAQLGDQLERQVRLVSLTVDPARDTPGRLKSYSAQHGTGTGWLWLTGPAPNVTAALKGFGTYTANFENHPAVVMVGDGRTGQWTRIYGFEDPAALVARVRGYLQARGGAAAATGKK